MTSAVATPPAADHASPATMERAVTLHQQGRLAEAGQLYSALLALEPDNPDALHLLGLVKFANGASDEALRLIDAACRTGAALAHMLLNRGLVLNTLGRTLEALASFESAIALDAKLAEAHNNRAVLLASLGRQEDALKSYRKALLLEPRDAGMRFNLGSLLKELGRFDEALVSFDAAIAIKPDYAEAMCNRGAVLHSMSRLEDALDSFDRALALRPDISEAHFNRGNVLRELQRFDEALGSYDCALAARPDYAEALCNRGAVLRNMKHFEEALECLARALALQPDSARAHLERGDVLRELDRFDEALASYDLAVAARTDCAEALCNRGVALTKLHRYEEALASYDRALALLPDDPVVLRNRGGALSGLKRFGEALATYEHVLALRPDAADLPDTLNNRGLALKELHRFDVAQASFHCAYARDPDHVEARWNEALLQLLLGDFSRGWAGYEWRWHREPVIRAPRDFPQPLWRGEQTIEGRTILVHSEQGLGDTIQFSRYVPLLAARGAHVIFEVQRPVHLLMRGLAAHVAVRGEPLPAFDCHCPLLSLPLAFDTRLDTIPAGTPYLHAPSPAARAWEARLQAHRRPRIGLVWSGNPDHTNDHNRSMSLRALSPLLKLNATFVSLQKDVRAADAAVLIEYSDILDFGGALTDFSETAALVSQLDLVITVDTSVAHLAGALGKPVWVLVTHVPDWRWLLDRDDSPWYPSARLFRQSEARDWDEVMVRVRDAAAEFVNACR